MDKQLTIRLFGGVAIELAGRPLTELRTRKTEALLAYLVCHRRPFPREHLAELLWDEREQQQALANLRSILSTLGRTLQPYLLITRQTVAFNHDSDYWLDTAEFERLLADPAITSLQHALSLYRGDFLEGFYLRECQGFEEWSLLERERLQRKAVSTLHLLVEDCAHHGRYQAGLELIDHLLRLDNLNEHTHRQKMTFLLRSGRRNAALSHYEKVGRLLAEELAVAPSAATQALYQRILAADFPPPCRLPATLTPFVGRAADIAAISQQLNAPGTRLLTILGPGGIGKTRLAIAAADTLARQQPGLFLDGIFFVSLTAVPTAPALPFYLANAFDLALSGPDSPQAQLLNYLRHKEILLVLDNYEHLLSHDEEGVALLAAILQEAPAVKLLVTSRQRLNLYGEQLFELAGLSLPPEQAGNPAAFDAVALFLQHAQRLQQDFTPTGEEMAHVVRACRLLEGVPLAIELAAGSIRHHPCAAIVAHIETNLDFLQAPYHNIPARQRSLRAVFDYSWSLLHPAGQAAFAHLSIFPDTFTAEAACQITGVTVETLAALADSSLLQRAEAGRYQIHPLLRQYAAEKLTGPPAAAIPQKHAAYYLDFLAAQGSGEEPAQRAAILADLPNVRAAWLWAAGRQDLAALARVAPTLHSFYSMQSWFQAGIDTFQHALNAVAAATAAAATAAPTPEQSRALCELWGRLARLRIHIGQLEAARQDLNHALLHLSHVNSLEQRAKIVGYLAIVTYYAGDYEQAKVLASESLQAAEAAGDGKGIAFGLNFLGSCAKAQGDYEEAHHYFEHAVTAYRQGQDPLGAAMVLNNLGNLAQARDNYEAAQGYYEACTALFKTLDHTHGAATTLANWGRLALKLKEYGKAEQLLRESLALKQSQNDERGVAIALVGLGALSVDRGNYAEAGRQLAQALALTQKSGDVKTALEGMVAVAALRWRQGDTAAATHLLSFILQQKGTVQEVCEQAEQLAADMGGITPVHTSLSLEEITTQLLAELPLTGAPA